MKSAGGEDLGKPPFSIDETLEPTDVAIAIVTCFERIAARPDRMQHGLTLSMRSFGYCADQPLYRAGQAIARAIDDGDGAGVPHGYHNARHFLEVVLCTLYLSRTACLDDSRTARVLIAALVHDFHHDGSKSAAEPFRLEALAVERAAPYLKRAGVALPMREQLQALVLATEPTIGVPFARFCLDRPAAPLPAAAAVPPAADSAPFALMRLLDEPELAFEAVLLAEADVLPSIGLTVAHGQHVQDRLAAEWQTPLGPEDKVRFVERLRNEIRVARCFLPNIDALGQAYRQQLSAARGSGDESADGSVLGRPGSMS